MASAVSHMVVCVKFDDQFITKVFDIVLPKLVKFIINFRFDERSYFALGDRNEALHVWVCEGMLLLFPCISYNINVPGGESNCIAYV